MTKKGQGVLPFVGSDAWILLAAVYSGRKDGADLRSLISAADYINHAVRSYEELSGGLARLRAAGLIVEKRGRYRPSETVLSAYARTTTPRRAVMKELDDMEIFLQSERRGECHPLPKRILTREMYEKAIREYLQSFSKR